MFSDDLRAQHWNKMAAACAGAFADGARGVVVTHGTDTLHHSAAALAFAFAGQGTRPAGPIASSVRSGLRTVVPATPRRTFSRPFIGLHTGRAQLGPLVTRR